MTSFISCPRCAQSLPMTAGFCRRCGLAVVAARPPQGNGRRHTRLLGTVVLLAVVAIGLTRVRSHHPSRKPVATPPVRTNGDGNTTSAPLIVNGIDRPVDAAPRTAYPLPRPSHYPPSVAAPPGYGSGHVARDGR